VYFVRVLGSFLLMSVQLWCGTFSKVLSSWDVQSIQLHWHVFQDSKLCGWLWVPISGFSLAGIVFLLLIFNLLKLNNISLIGFSLALPKFLS